MRAHQRLVLALRLAVLVFLIGGWELGMLELVDPVLRPALGIVPEADRLD